MSEYKTLVELIEARKNEEQKGITFILGDSEEKFVSYKQIYLKSLKLLYAFQQSGHKQGDEVIFQIEDNERFLYSFWACVLGGMIPVPITTGNNDEHKLKLFKIWNILNNPKIIISAGFLEKLETYAIKNGLSRQMESLRNSAMYVENAMQEERFGSVYHPRPEDIALIQFSSGSTGDPKGVVITHNNIIIDLSSVIKWDQIDSNDVGLNWMPLTHDMGLIGTHIKEMLAGINQFNIHTQLFIRHPSLWISKASEHKATLLSSPNFGYKHFLKFYNSEANHEWDLSNVRIIYNGAEPTSLELCNEFLDKMSVYGLKRNTMKPCYGLAEGTIAVAFLKVGEEITYNILDRRHLGIGDTVTDTKKEDKNSVIFVEQGYPIYNSYVRICDEENNDVGENKIGYIQISGGNVTSGYYNNKKATEETITQDGWLNTGDLGFIRNKRLTITGRAKDIIFAGGQNFYSHDIERIGECVESIELGKIVATGVFNDELRSDELILFVMYRKKIESFTSIASNLKKTISQRIGIEVSEVIPIKDIPKTTSGKVQRYKLRENYINGDYDQIKQQLHALMIEELRGREIVQPTTNVQKELVKIWSDILNINHIGIRDNFFELGGDSLRITQMASRVRDSFQVELSQSEIFDNPEIESLAKVIENAVQNNNSTSSKIGFNTNEAMKNQLSFSQQRLWFLDRLNLESPQYNLYTGLVFKGKLNFGALKKSFAEIIKRHKLLQSYFVEENGQPVQIFDPEVIMPIEFTDLRDIPEKERMSKAEELAKKETRKTFNLEKAPLIRGNLICIDNNEHILILVVHHIIFDGWSFGILLKELNHYYETYLNGSQQTLPELEIQYVDFSQWQKEKLQEGYLKNQLEYWKNQLYGCLTLDLPLDKQRPPVQTYNGAKFTSLLSTELVNGLQQYARKENVTLFMVLLSAFKVLLYRYSGQSDIVIGSPIANRNRKDIEGLIGFFTNNIILRTCFSNEIKFNELLKKVKQVTVEAYSNQDVPFEKIVEELHIERDMSRNPLFQVLFGMQNMPIPNMEFSEMNMSTLDLDAGYSRFDLSVDIRNAGEGLAADFEYNTDLFNADTIIRMSGHYRQLLEGIVKNPNLLLDEYEILTLEEKKIILNDWNDTEEDIGKYSNWIEIFEEQADVRPDAVAVICGNYQMTYAELDENSNRLANYLKSNGIGCESIVGVYIDRSINMLIGLLAIHKAGAAYLPMDPIFPKDRLAYMIEDANVSIILSEEKLSDTLPYHNAKVICLDSEREIVLNSSASRIPHNNESNSLAYVIYTSGSTGKPKGVQIEQHALINLLLSFAKKTEMKESDSLLAVTTLSFDIAGLELYMPLICGAKVIIAERDDVTDGNKLIEILDEHSVTMMQATPATWRLLIESGWAGSSKLKILCGGEALPKDLANQLLQRCLMLFNVYGPTETTIWSTFDRVEFDTKTVYIGKPIANTQVYVVDSSMNTVPIGIPGELLIGGDGLARGYMNLPVLTNEKFIPDYFRKKHGAFLYRTGDVVKFTSNGKLEYVGRKDNQVKIRGYRIELGEIEALINQEQFVNECVVVAKELIQGEKSLVAYIIPSSEISGSNIDTEYIRKSLKEKLPDYMVPAVYMVMKSFPMTPNGKIDRKALPEPERIINRDEINYIAPSSEIEKQLESIWKEVLKLDKIDVNSNFFDLGGHSLLLAQVRSKIGNVLNKEVSMLDLFKYPTISALSGFLLSSNGQKTEVKTSKTQKNITKSGKIAIIGLSGRFPGARNIDEFWNNLCNGVNSISRFTDEQVIEEGINPEIVKKPGYVKAWGVLDDVDMFDAQFFGYNPREAEMLDPQQRIFLEESWKAFDDAGYNSEKFKGTVGVYASVGMNTYAQNLKNSFDSNGLASEYQIMTSNDKDFLSTRIAYKLNLEGPSITVQTACSSSLVAVHLASQSLMNGECDMALAGGVSVRLPQRTGYLYQEGMILSPDGNCRAFDEQAKGTVGGNGVGVVVLKRFEDAVADGDNISAVILGSAVNNDGALKIGFTAPRIDGQANAIYKAQEKAGIDAQSITYVEAHGTGTPLGDPIEIEALTQAFRKMTDKKEYCAIGSVKTNIGHLDAAAGVTGLIKTVLALRNKMLPPSLNFESPNEKINFKESPFFVNKSLKAWNNGNDPLRAGVSAFGIGGTNVHVILEEGPMLNSDLSKGESLLFTLSAKSKNALNSMTRNLISFLETNKDVNLADVAYTLQLGRKEFEFKRFFISSSVEGALELLKNNDEYPKKIFDSTDEQNNISQQSLLENPKDYSLEQLGQMWLSGARIDWEKLYEGQNRKRISLPAYPFEGQSFWAKKSIPAEIEKATLMNKRSDVSEWFYTPIWKQSVDGRNYDLEDSNRDEILLVLKDSYKFTDVFENRLKENHANILVAVSGKEYKQIDEKSYIFDAENSSHYELLMSELSKNGKTPSRIVNLLGINQNNTGFNALDNMYLGEKLFYSMMYLAQAIGKSGITSQIQFKVLINNSQRIFSKYELNPEIALHFGACRVIPIEYQNIKCCSIDFTLPENGSLQELELIDLLIDEIYFMPCEGFVAYRGTDRWKQDFERIKPEDKNYHNIKLRDEGVYLITGGLGGIGLETAQYLSSQALRAKLILIARSKFPEIEQWENWLETHSKKDKITQKIMRLKQIISTGAEICIYQADVTEQSQMKDICKKIMSTYGKIDGIIHAAGNSGGGMIQIKSKEHAQRVLTPKVKGTITLFDTFKDSGIDFMIFYSSLNALTGGFGQLDYSSANAFLDAFAQAHDSINGTRFIAIDWDRWPGIGMASGTPGSDNTQQIHPLLGKCVMNNEDKIIYSGEFSPETEWVLSEHIVLGIPTIAGTTYLEMARAAFEDITGNSNAEISEVLFLSPLAVKQGEKRNVYTVMTKSGDDYNFQIISNITGKERDIANSNPLEHIRGKITPSSKNKGMTFDIKNLKEKCEARTLYSQDGKYTISEDFISFGGRWRSLKNFSLGNNEGLVEVELDDKFINDLENYKIHPALLDVATGAVRLAAKGNYLPFSYEKLDIYEMLPGKIYGHIRFKNSYDSSSEIITSDIDIIGENGVQLIEIKNFSMKLINEASAETIKGRTSAVNQQPENTLAKRLIEEVQSQKIGILQDGIRVEEGLKALNYIFNGCFKPQIIVSTKDINSAIEQANYIDQPNLKDTIMASTVSKKRHPRPEVENEYVSPKNETEKKLAELWQDVLGIDKVGIHDEFFALGGDSLLLIQFHTKLKEEFKTDIAVIDLYKFNTISLLAKHLSDENTEEEQPAFEEVNSRANKQIELLKRRKQQMLRTKGVTLSE